jgi:hypothetical protein
MTRNANSEFETNADFTLIAAVEALVQQNQLKQHGLHKFRQLNKTWMKFQRVASITD